MPKWLFDVLTLLIIGILNNFHLNKALVTSIVCDIEVIITYDLKKATDKFENS